MAPGLTGITFTTSSLAQACSEFERERKAIVPLLAHGRDRGSADFWIRLDQLEEPPYTFDPAVRILRVRYIAVANDVINDLDMKTVSDSPTLAGKGNTYDHTTLAHKAFGVLEVGCI